MQDWSDQQLLAEYARNASDAAFEEVVRRQVGLVYGVALRIARDPALAEDVTQEVFVTAAGKAGLLAQHPTLCAWLHLTARNVATKSIRREARRRAREQEANAMQELHENRTQDSWDRIAPRLDELLGRLNEPDREALLLRFFQNKFARETAEFLNVSAEAAQKRVSRALERLRALFTAEDLTLGASFAGDLEEHAAFTLPPGLVPSIMASVAERGGAARTESTAPSPWRLAALAGVLLALAALLIFQQAGAQNQTAGAPQPNAMPGRAWTPNPQRLGEQIPPEILATSLPVEIPRRRFPASAWEFAGLGEPEDTLVTYMWAKQRGDVKTVASTSTPELNAALSKEFLQGRTDAEISAMLIESGANQTGFEILAKRITGAGTTVLEVQFGGDAPGESTVLTFRKVGGEWLIAGFEERPGAATGAGR